MMESSLPRLLVIADGFTRRSNHDRILQMASHGVLPWVQLRDHRASPGTFAAGARKLISEIRGVSPQTLISVNGYSDLALELVVGLHLGFRSISPGEARRSMGTDAVIGYSAHTEGDMTVIADCDYTTLSPVFPVTKPNASAPLGLERLATLVKETTKPVFALGSVSVDRVAGCLSAGAYGVATLSGVMGASDPVAAGKAYADAIEEALAVW